MPEPGRFKGRIRLVDATSLLIEQTPADFARAHGFRFLGTPDNIATNPAVAYRVEKFDLAEAQKKNPEFKPEQPYASRLSWAKGARGESVLLQNSPDAVAAVVHRGQPDRSPQQPKRKPEPRPMPRS